MAAKKTFEENMARLEQIVTLLEKGDALGGTLNIAKLPPHKANLQDVTDVLALEARELGVTVKLNTEAPSVAELKAQGCVEEEAESVTTEPVVEDVPPEEPAPEQEVPETPAEEAAAPEEAPAAPEEPKQDV